MSLLHSLFHIVALFEFVKGFVMFVEKFVHHTIHANVARLQNFTPLLSLFLEIVLLDFEHFFEDLANVII